MGLCCINCFADDFIRAFVANEQTTGDCDYCGTTNTAIAETSRVGKFIREGLAKAYEHVDVTGLYFDPVDKEYIAGESAIDVLNNEGVFSELIYTQFIDEALAKNLFDDSGLTHYQVAGGEYDWLDGGSALIVLRGEFAGSEGTHYQSSWNSFRASVKYHARFFDLPEFETREALLGPIVDFFPKIERQLRVGTSLYRARIAKGNLPVEAWLKQKELGPPPVGDSKHSRMSPPGISYAYLSKEADTCIAEIKPNVGDEVWLAKFVTKKKLKIIDLTLVPRVRVPSIFNPNYDHNLRWAQDFFEHFQNEISDPTGTGDNLLDYVPTQVLAEFIHTQGYDGIKFKSSQNPKGVNYTLFCGPDYDFQAGYWPKRPPFHEWIRLEQIEYIDIAAMKLKTVPWNSSVIPVDELINPDGVNVEF